ncbi:uncharacterized protein LOC113467478 [Diaphorina citri]|uniref:Uncharacterized protein LOC113467478 n=1 Tax=Diaphorina citri TaxID=121845 RepID=A0A3Q0IXS3_DIACI|nr:uncharacterized protein LOC113467478 [Diaphorina citri]
MGSSRLFLSIVALILLCSLFPTSYCWKVYLYRDSDYRGGHIEMEGDGCQGIPRDFNDKTSSVNTHGGCVRLYEHDGCTGRTLELFPGSGTHMNLKAHKFNDKATSVGNCPRRRREAGRGQFNSFW